MIDNILIAHISPLLFSSLLCKTKIKKGQKCVPPKYLTGYDWQHTHCPYFYLFSCLLNKIKIQKEGKGEWKECFTKNGLLVWWTIILWPYLAFALPKAYVLWILESMKMRRKKRTILDSAPFRFGKGQVVAFTFHLMNLFITGMDGDNDDTGVARAWSSEKVKVKLTQISRCGTVHAWHCSVSPPRELILKLPVVSYLIRMLLF